MPPSSDGDDGVSKQICITHFNVIVSLPELFSQKYNDCCLYFEAGTPSGRCHPEAQYYKDKFGKKKEELCRKLFTMYNDKIFDNKVRNRY